MPNPSRAEDIRRAQLTPYWAAAIARSAAIQGRTSVPGSAISVSRTWRTSSGTVAGSSAPAIAAAVAAATTPGCRRA
jgi:hypothetical protein